MGGACTGPSQSRVENATAILNPAWMGDSFSVHQRVRNKATPLCLIDSQ
jgi:hypothetical protein